jgi:hypothetical protein
MTDDEELQSLIQRGHEAAELLRNRAFNNLVAELKDTYFNRWLSSANADEREKIHASALSLEDMVNSLMGQVSEMEQWQARLESENQESVEESWDDWVKNFEDD